MTPSELFDQIIQAAPSFKRVRRDHMAYYDEPLPHVLMADVLRYLQSHYSQEPLYSAEPPSDEQVAAIFVVLDRGLLQGDSEATNAIQVSFLEGIENEAYFDRLEPMLGKAARDELDRQKAWWQEHARDA